MSGAVERRCTCGTVPGAKHYDVTSSCEDGGHDLCAGHLMQATGFHWWCACLCHPTPEPYDTARVAHNEAALRTWRNAQATLTAALDPEETP